MAKNPPDAVIVDVMEDTIIHGPDDAMIDARPFSNTRSLDPW